MFLPETRCSTILYIIGPAWKIWILSAARRLVITEHIIWTMHVSLRLWKNLWGEGILAPGVGAKGIRIRIVMPSCLFMTLLMS